MTSFYDIDSMLLIQDVYVFPLEILPRTAFVGTLGLRTRPIEKRSGGELKSTCRQYSTATCRWGFGRSARTRHQARKKHYLSKRTSAVHKKNILLDKIHSKKSHSDRTTLLCRRSSAHSSAAAYRFPQWQRVCGDMVALESKNSEAHPAAVRYAGEARRIGFGTVAGEHGKARRGCRRAAPNAVDAACA